MRAIDADKLLEEVNKEYEEARAEFLKDGDKNPYMSGKADGLGKAHFLITGQPTTDGWIPITKDTMPPKKNMYYVTCHREDIAGNGTSGAFYAGNGEWEVEDYDETWEVIAWQPLPEPYRGGAR